MSDAIIFRADAAEFEAAMRDLQRLTGHALRDIWKQEVRTVIRRLIRYEYRARPAKVRADLMSRLVLLWNTGGEFNVPKERKEEFRRAPAGATRHYRARRSKRLIPAKPAEVSRYTRRVGYLVSGWGQAAMEAGISNLPQYIIRHRTGETGLAIPGFDNPSGPRFYMANLANPRDGSKAKLDATLRIQAGAIRRSINAGIDRAFDRIRPTI